MRIVRLLIYEGPEERLIQQLGGSMADGVKRMGDLTITSMTLGDLPNPVRVLWEEHDTRGEEHPI